MTVFRKLITCAMFVAAAPAFANTRYFESNGSKAKVWLQEFKQGGKDLAYFKVSNVSHPQADRVFLFFKDKSNGFAPMHQATALAIFDYDKGTLVNGSLKKAWTVPGLGKDPEYFVEHTPRGPAGDMKGEYDKAEGLGAEGEAMDKIIAKAKSELAADCGSKVSLQVTNASFGKAGAPPNHKVLGAVRGFTSLCKADADYKGAIAELKSIAIAGTGPGKVVTAKSGANGVSVKVPADAANTPEVIHDQLKASL